MSKIKRTLLHGVLLSALTVAPLSAFGMVNGDGDGDMKSNSTHEKETKVEKAGVYFRFGGGGPYYYRARPYYRPYYYRAQPYYRPFYFNYPYRNYYYRYY